MAFQLGQFIVQLLGDTTHLDGALKRVQGGFSSLGNAIKGAFGLGSTEGVKGLEKTKNDLTGAEKAAKGLRGAFEKLLEIDLSTVFQLGTIAGTIGLLTQATKKFMDLQDEVKNTQFRFRVLGMETEENTKKLFEFGKSMSEAFNIGQGEARKLSMDALTKGINPGRYQEMTSSAVGLSNALGISADRAMHVVEQLEAGHTMVLRRLHPAFRILMEQGASRFTLEAKVNEMIAQGAEIAKERMNTFGGQIQRLKNNFSALGVAIANAVGPAFTPWVTKAADALDRLAKRITEYVNANKETIGATIRTGAAIAVTASAFLLLRGHVSSVLGLFTHLLPSVGGLWSAFQFGYGLTPFASLFRGLGLLKSAIGGLVGFTVQAGVQMALFLFSPTRIAAALTQAAILAYNLVVGGMGVAMGIATMSARLLSVAIRGVMFATGIGILVGLAGMLLGVADTFGNAATGADGFGEIVKRVFHEFRDIIEPVLLWLRTEGEIVFRALIASARQVVNGMVEAWGYLKQAWGEVVKYLRENFGGAIRWIEDTFNIKIDSIKSMWEEFTAELTVIGLRVRQVFLVWAIELAMIPTVVRWLGDVFAAFADYIAKDWKTALVDSLKTYWEYLKLTGTAIMEIGDKIGKALSGESVTFDFNATQAQFDRLKEQANHVLAKIEIPALDVSKVAPEMRGELDRVTKEINEKKQQAREAQAAARTAAQNRGTGKTTAGEPIKSGTMIGSRDKAHFQETVGFWKKVQEAGANQRAEYIQMQQLDQQREMVRLLGAIHQANVSKPLPPAGGVVPR